MNLPPHIHTLPAYVPGETLPALAARLGIPVNSIIKLDANENPYDPPPAVRQALAELTNANLYPDPEYRTLRSALAAYTGVASEYLLAGNGSDELLALLAQTLLEPGDRVLVCPPTFPMYAFYARLNNAEVISVPRQEDFSVDVDGIMAAAEKFSPKIIFLDTPGNPSGTVLPVAEVRRLLTLPALIVCDEAYIEFAGSPSMIAEVPERDNLVVLRTFSKWAGLAGFRIGYGAFPKWLGGALWTVKSPYNVTVPAAAAAIAALSETETLMKTVSAIRTQRDRLAAELGRYPGLTIYPSAGNFVFIRVGPVFGKTATEICAALKEHGILIRLYADLDCLRITAGKSEHTDALINALSQVKG